MKKYLFNILTSLVLALTFTVSASASDLWVDPHAGATIFSGDITVGSGFHVILPSDNDAVTPTLCWGDCDTGFYESSDDNIILTFAGGNHWHFNANGIGGNTVGTSTLRNATASATVPGFAFIGDTDTGIGWSTMGTAHLIADSVDVVSWSSLSVAVAPQLALGGVTPVAGTSILLPTGDGNGIGWGDGDSFFYESADDVLGLKLAGFVRYIITISSIYGNTTNAAALWNETASSTNPTLTPNRNDADTGIGWNSSEDLSMVSAGVEVGRFDDDATAQASRFLIYDIDNATITRVMFGNDNSGGAGFKHLIVAN